MRRRQVGEKGGHCRRELGLPSSARRKRNCGV
jgi:hypothetical protein